MTTPTSPLDVLDELEKAATPGEWLAAPTPKDAAGFSSCCGIAGVGGGKSGMIYAKASGGVFPSADKRLIIGSRNSYPALLAYARALEAENEALVLAASTLGDEPARRPDLWIAAGAAKHKSESARRALSEAVKQNGGER